MTHFSCSEEEATVCLQAMWNNANVLVPHTPSPPPPAPPPPPPPPQPQVQLDIEPIFPIRKKTTFPDFDEDAFVPNKLPFFPAQFALDKIKIMEYVELWYFTAEGILDANKVTPTADNDTFGFLNTNAGIALQHTKASKASHNVICDEAVRATLP